MRNDLPSLSSGRAAAQASHASNAFWHMYGSTKEAKEWAACTSQGFGTTIVLGANLETIKTKLGESSRQWFMTSVVTDPDYAISISSEVLPYIDKNVPIISEVGVTSGVPRLELSQTDPTKYILHRQEDTCAFIFGDKEALAPLLSDLPLYS